MDMIYFSILIGSSIHLYLKLVISVKKILLPLTSDKTYNHIYN